MYKRIQHHAKSAYYSDLNQVCVLVKSECFGYCYEYKHEGGVVRSDIGQRNGFSSGFARCNYSFWPRCSVYKRFVPQSNHTVWYPAKHESCRQLLPWQCSLQKYVGQNEDRITIRSIRPGTVNRGAAEIAGLEILYELLEQSPHLLRQWWLTTHGETQ